MIILVSACLLGKPCRYDGSAKTYDGLAALSKQHTLIPVCPEVLGGLPTPRPPAEIRDGRVINREGLDVTDAYCRGAEAALQLAKASGARVAVLKERSPSCGSRVIHNGRFDGGLVDGWGITAELLRRNGITVYGENAINDLL